MLSWWCPSREGLGTLPGFPLQRLVALQADDVLEGLSSRDHRRSPILPVHLRGPAQRDVVGSHRRAEGARVVQHQQVAHVGAAEGTRDQQLAIVAREDVAALAQRPAMYGSYHHI